MEINIKTRKELLEDAQEELDAAQLVGHNEEASEYHLNNAKTILQRINASKRNKNDTTPPGFPEELS